MSGDSVLGEFIHYSVHQLEQNLGQILRCLRLLNEQELWHRPNEQTNSIGNLVLHVTGNVGQWVLGAVGGQQVERDRQREFSERGPLPIDAVAVPLERTVRQAVQILRGLAPATLGQRCTIQGYDVSRLVAIFHVVSHFCFHAGQIIHATKTLRDVDLSLYDHDGRRLNGSPWP